MAFVADFYGRSHSSDRFMADGGGFSVFGIIADLIGGSHKPGRKKNSHKVVCSEGCRAKRKLSRQTDFAESDSMASLLRKRTDFMGKSVYRGTW